MSAPARQSDPVDVRDLLARLVPALAGRTVDGASDPAVLLLAYPRNPDAVGLERALLARGVPCQLLGTDDFPRGASLRWRGDRPAGLSCSGREIDLSAVRGVWFALAEHGAPAGAGSGEPERQFVEREWRDALAGLWRDLPVRVVNPPDANIAAGNKITGLRAAASAGLAVPDTLVTNDPELATAFVVEHGAVVAKTLHSHYVEIDGRRHSLFTRLLTPADVALLPAALPAAPCVFQPYLDDKDVEIRASVVGDRVLSAELRTREAGLDATAAVDLVDIRRVSRQVPMAVHELPDEVAKRCVALVADLGLHYAALDLVRTTAGEYVFLDLNPRGGWWFVERRTGLPISDAVAALVAGTVGAAA